MRLKTACPGLLALALCLPLASLFAADGTQPKDGPALKPALPTSPLATARLATPEAPAAPATPPQPTAPALTQADVEAWMDGFMPYAMARGDIAGSVVVVVKDGQVLFQKGYGYSDVAKRTPVDPERTLFRPGSVSKLFTWTAVMQLVEQGRLDLDADVNKYLDFKIPLRDGKPVTLRMAMTHTTGMEETARELISDDSEHVKPLGDYLKHWVPTRIFAAGSTPAYSNYATAMAGYIVQRVSGQPFDDYIDQHIFKPLGMQHASFRQPLPAALQPLMSQGYALGSDDKAKPFEIVTPAPAGSLSASGADMGRFMIAHLQDGAFGDQRILSARTAETMHHTPTDMIAPLNRMLLGFYETNVNGHRAISHGGDTQWFHSYLHLFPDDGIGLFVSVNSGGKEGAAGVVRTALYSGFADRYLPGKLTDGKVDDATAKQHAAQMAGVYDNSRRSADNFVTLANLAGQSKVVANADGTLTVPALTAANGQPKKWREIAPYVWRDMAGTDRLAAKVVDGKVQRWSSDPFSAFMVFERTPWWQSSSWLLPLVGFALGALLLTVLAWPVSALVRRYYRQDYKLTGIAARAHRWMRIAALAVLVTVGGYMTLLVMMLGDLDMLKASNDWLVIGFRLLSLVVLPLAALVSLWHAGVVLRGDRRRTAKLWSIVLAVSCLAVLWMAVAFHMVGFTANY